jgi:hypothetical protein
MPSEQRVVRMQTMDENVARQGAHFCLDREYACGTSHLKTIGHAISYCT